MIIAGNIYMQPDEQHDKEHYQNNKLYKKTYKQQNTTANKTVNVINMCDNINNREQRMNGYLNTLINNDKIL